MIPTTVEEAAIRPIVDSDAPRLLVNRGNTGFFDMVELKIANIPVPHNRMKGENILFIIAFPVLVVILFRLAFLSGF
jgi:hypothetical protein